MALIDTDDVPLEKIFGIPLGYHEPTGTWHPLTLDADGNLLTDAKNDCGDCVEVPWAFDTVSPLTITIAGIGDRVADAELIIDEPFDDAAATIKLGTLSTPERFIKAINVDPLTANNHVNSINTPQTVAQTIILTISPGTSTTGRGIVIIKIRRA